MEFGRPRIIELFDLVEKAHFNFYEHQLDRDDVQLHIGQSRELLGLLDDVRNSPPRRFTPANRDQERRLERLTRYDPNRAVDAALDIETLPPVEPEG